MKKIYVLLSLAALSLCQLHAENKVHSVDVKARLDSLGNASICETWSVNINSSNTEWYLSLANLGNGRISNLTVRDLTDGRTYQTEDRWDVDRTREQKAGRCGIVSKGSSGVELCWGVTSDGDHLWEVSYDYENLITAFTDSCAFNHMFVSSGLSSPPRSARVEISFPGKEITDSIASIWAFGFEGEVAYRNGSIVAESYGPLDKEDGIIVMAAFDKRLFNSGNTSSDSFSVMKERALRDSDYIEDADPMSFLDIIITLVVIVLGILACITIYYIGEAVMAVGAVFVICVIIPLLWSVVSLFPIRMYVKRRRLLGSRPYTRDIPKDKDLTRVPYILDHFSYNILSSPQNWDDNLTAAYLMRLIAENAIYIDKSATENGKLKPMLHVRDGWKPEPGKYSEADSEAMTSLYDIIKGASGSDLILQKGELRSYKKKEGMQQVRRFYKRRKISDFKIDNEEAVQIMGLQAFLKDLTISSERDIPEIGLWGELLVYATLFGVADKVLRSMRQIAPGYPLLDKICDDSGAYLLGSVVMSDFYRDMRHIRNESAPKGSRSGGNGYGGYTSRSSGGGGRSSHSGGHGHSGGGGGGGR